MRCAAPLPKEKRDVFEYDIGGGSKPCRPGRVRLDQVCGSAPGRGSLIGRGEAQEDASDVGPAAVLFTGEPPRRAERGVDLQVDSSHAAQKAAVDLDGDAAALLVGSHGLSPVVKRVPHDTWRWCFKKTGQDTAEDRALKSFGGGLFARGSKSRCRSRR